MVDKAFLKYMLNFVNDQRLALFEKVLSNRTSYISVVLEDIYQSQNASAVLRSCDCFGVQQVNIIENKFKFEINLDVTQGSSKWLSLRKFDSKENNTLEAINTLKKEGYRIVATSPHQKDVKLEDFDIHEGKFALVFGTEMEGISEIVKENADEFIQIPMYGFTESFNISVSAALCMHHLSHKMRHSDLDWQLMEEERDQILLDWTMKNVKYAELVEKEYRARLAK